MTHLKYNRGAIIYSTPTFRKRCSSSELSSWGAFETNINSLTSETNPFYVISAIEGEKVRCVLSTSEEISWESIDSSLWDAVKAEVESL
jgi:hypothetical protein